MLKFSSRGTRLCKNRRAVPIRIGINELNRVFEGLDIRAAQHRTENFFSIRDVRWVHGQYRGADEIPVGIFWHDDATTVEVTRRTFLNAPFN